MLSSTIEPGDIWKNDNSQFHNIIIEPDIVNPWWITWVIELGEYNLYHKDDFDMRWWRKVA